MTYRVSLTLTLLQSYYATVYNLRVYLSQVLVNVDELDLVQDGDSESYLAFINGAYVALKGDTHPRIRAESPVVHMGQVIKYAQSHTLRMPKSNSSNLIAAGYRLARRESTFAEANNLMLENYCVNTMVTALQAPEWETLLQRIGDGAMLHLLKDTSVFMPLPNECLCQMTGQPIINIKHINPTAKSKVQVPPSTKTELKRKASDIDVNERPAKRVKLHPSTYLASNSSRSSSSKRKPSKNPPPSRRPPSDINFFRVRMFYSRPSLLPNSKNLIVGLPAHHVLNQIKPCYVRKTKVDPDVWVDPDPNEQLNHARHLAKYVFPRQHGLSNPFDCSKDDPGVVYNYAREIKQKGFIKTPKRVKSALDLLEKLIWRHGKCGYKPLRDKLCPAKIDHRAPLDENQTMIRRTQFLELMSEHGSSQLVSQAISAAGNTSVDSEGVTISAIGLTQAAEYANAKPRCVDFAISHFEVYRYAVVVTEEVIPKAFWGSKKNFEVVTKYIKEFIDGRRYETMSLHHVLQNFSTSDCDWVISDNPAAQQQSRVSVSDSLKRRELVEEFIYWYFNSFLLALLKTSFYATESSMFRNRILYFRQDDWKALCEPLIERLTKITFKEMDPIDAQELLRQRKMGFSFVRLLPKEAGVRPIVNLRRNTSNSNTSTGQKEPINRILKAAFEILNYEKDTNPELLGESVFGPDEVYRKLKIFKTKLNGGDQSKKLPKLYFVKVDVQACFDTIDQGKLLEIIRDVISEDSYTIRRYGALTPNLGKFTRRFNRKAMPADDVTDFFPYAIELASALRHTIFVDQVHYHSETRPEILALLEEHITENIVKIGDVYYRQVVGIPQGSILSTLLCSFAYGDLERRKFKFSQDPESALLRLVDDYMLITTNVLKAQTFLQMMTEGHPEYGCTISQDKTKTNFNFGSQVSNVIDPHQKEFPWCGYLIDMKDLSVSSDYSRFSKKYVEDSLTVLTGREPGVAFTTKMIRMSRHKSHAIYCDTDLNTIRVVYFNMYTNFLLSAMKMHRYLKTWGVNFENSSNMVSGMVDQMIRSTFKTIQNKISNKLAKSLNARCDIKEISVVWLGAHAFRTILSRFPDKYAHTLKKLDSELSRSQHNVSRREFSGLVQEGLKTFDHIQI